MGDERSRRFAELLSLQLNMNKQTLAALREHGVDENTLLRLDFSYEAPTERAGEELAAFLRDETDYEVETISMKRGLLKKRAWTVQGSTQQTAIDDQTLDEWVTWMVVAGSEHGDCEFDGWGAQVPE